MNTAMTVAVSRPRIRFTLSRSFPRLALLVVIALASLTACGTKLTPRIARVDGRAVEVASAGEGTATVVFESGLGNDWTNWDEVASQVALHSRVFAYSRPGYGRSDDATTPRDATHIVEELRALLASQGVLPPYVLVGHSNGGGYMELFARLHPGEVSGVVLVDPRHPDFLATCEREGVGACGIPESALDTLPSVQSSEYRAYAMTSEQVRLAGSFGSYPMRILTATNHGNSPAWETLWASMHASLASEAVDGRQILVQGAGHVVQFDRPGDVVRAIVDVLPQSGR